MPTDTAPRRPSGAKFMLRAVAWSLGLFGLLRLAWVERHALLPLTKIQENLSVWLCGTPARPITATLECSGADVVAVCLGVILAFPVRWRTRLVGAGCGLVLILAINTMRIGTLGRLAASQSLFHTFHVYIWPAVLSLAVACYVLAWMSHAHRGHPAGSPTRLGTATATATEPGERRGFHPTRRFAIFAGIFLLIFTAAAPIYLESAGVLSVAAVIARAAAAALRLLGVEARATGNLLWTSRGSFLVNQECISTPLIPIYLAAVIVFARTWRTRLPALLAALPLFVGLGVARLLVVALPASVAASPVYLIHAFYQILLGAVIVVIAASWRRPGGGTAVRRSLCGLGLGAAFILLLGSSYARMVGHAAQVLCAAASTGDIGASPEDPQGAVALMSAFQVGLYLALWVAARVKRGWRRFVAGLALLGLAQLATLMLLPQLAGNVGIPLQVQGVRAWAVAAPLFVVAFMHLFGSPTGVSQPETRREAGVRG